MFLKINMAFLSKSSSQMMAKTAFEWFMWPVACSAHKPFFWKLQPLAARVQLMAFFCYNEQAAHDTGGGMLQIQTERLLLRDFTHDDIVNIYKLMSNEKVMYYLDLPHPDIAYSKNYLDNILMRITESPRMLWKMAITLADNHFLGMISLEVETNYLRDGRADLSYYLMPEYWGIGYAAEASKAIIRYGFIEIKLNKITAGCLSVNSSSEKVMIACNMVKEASLKKHTTFKGVWVDRYEYAILKDDYFNNCVWHA